MLFVAFINLKLRSLPWSPIAPVMRVRDHAGQPLGSEGTGTGTGKAIGLVVVAVMAPQVLAHKWAC